MAMFHLLKIRTSKDIFKNEKCKVTFGLEYISFDFPELELNKRPRSSRPNRNNNISAWLK